jgi:hypothetical protein
VRKRALVLNLDGLKAVISKDLALIICVPLMDDLSVRQKPTVDSPLVRRIAAMVAMQAFEPGQGMWGCLIRF